MSMWTATVCRPIYWRGATIREGQTLELTDQQMRDLDRAGVIGNIKRVAAPVAMAVTDPPENASRAYARRGR